MARSCHTTQFGRCELVGGGLPWHALQHDDDDHDDRDVNNGHHGNRDEDDDVDYDVKYDYRD